ncbi:MAG TPA: hypothetical protein VF984_01150 [Actinomycetota bacterium]
MRPFTKLTLIVLFSLILVAAVAQLLIAAGDHEPYPGPVSGTPLPTSVPSP